MASKRVERFLKSIGFALLRTVAPRRRPLPDRDAIARFERVLVLRLDERIGNAVLLTSMLAALRSQFPLTRIDCMLSFRYADLRRFIPSVDRFVLFDKHRLARRPWEFLRTVRSIRGERYDCVFDASADQTVSFTHLALCAFSGGRVRVGHDRGGMGRLYDLSVPVPDHVRHAADTHVDLLDALAPVADRPLPKLHVVTDDEVLARLCRSQEIDSDLPLVLIHPGARGRKRWPPEQFAELTRRLAATVRANLVLVWGPSDVQTAEVVVKLGDNTLRPAGILAFVELLQLIRRADVFVSADTGPMHLASAVGAPVVAVFLHTDPAQYGPRDPASIVLDGRDRALSAGDVADAVLGILRHNTLRGAASPPREAFAS